MTTTLIGFTLSSLGLAFCGIRFFRAFQKIGNISRGKRIGILLSVLHFIFAVAHGLIAIGIGFFSHNPQMIYRFIVASNSFLAGAAALGTYLIFYILFPKTSPWPGTILASAYGMMLVFVTIITQPRPFIDISGGIDWNFSSWMSILLSYVLLIGIGSIFIIFMHSFRQAKSREMRITSFILSALALVGIINVSIRFLLPVIISNGTTVNILQTRIFDTTHALIGVIFISVFVFPPIIIRQLAQIKNK